MAPKAAPKAATPMNVLELVTHTLGVVQEKNASDDNKKAQPIGPAENVKDFVIMLAVITAVMCIVYMVVEKFASRLGSSLGLRGGKAGRFAASFLEACFYSLSLCLGYAIFKDSTWLWPAGWDKEVMADGRVQKIEGLAAYHIAPETKLLYMLEIANVVNGLLRLLTRKRKKDFLEMFFHHIVTIGLLMLSYTTGYIRIGVVVYLLHNAFDPFLHIAKCSHYVKAPVLPDVSFACCAITFAVTRLYLFPKAILAAWNGVCVGNKTCPGGVWDKSLVENILIGLLVALLPIHCLWFYMILRVFVISLKNSGVQGDVRSDSEDEDEEPPSPQHSSPMKKRD